MINVKFMQGRLQSNTIWNTSNVNVDQTYNDAKLCRDISQMIVLGVNAVALKLLLLGLLLLLYRILLKNSWFFTGVNRILETMLKLI